MRINQKRGDLIKELINTIPTEDVNREGLKNTPNRVARMYKEIFAGYEQDSEELFKSVFTSDNNSMITVRDIDFYSYCEHHMVPFFGKVHIGYIPKGKILGISKFARLVDVYAKRLQIQEQLTEQIANDIEKYLKPKGLMVIISAQHLCMAMRGIKKINSSTVTNSVKGIFKDELVVREEFLNTLNLKSL